MKILIYLSLGVFLSVAFNGCMDKVNLDNASQFNYHGEWAIPLVQASLNLSDIVANDSNFIVDPDNGIRIVYHEDSIAGFVLSDFVEIPNQDPELLTLMAGSPPMIQNIDMESLGGVELKYLTISKGKLVWEVDNSSNFPVSFEVAITNASLNGDTAKFLILNNPSGINTGEVDISGLHFDLTTGAFGFNNLTYRIIITDDGGAPIGSQYDVRINLEDFEVQEAVGFFGERAIPVPSTILETKIGSFENILSGLRIENPIIELIIDGNIGLPLSFIPDFDGVNKNGVVTPLILPDIIYDGPISQGSWKKSNYLINKDNSNIVDFIASIPKDIAFAGEVKINPNGDLGVDNFVTKEGQIKVGMNIEIPLEFRVKNLILEQWLYDIDWGVEDNEKDIIEKLYLHFKVTNGFPFDANLNMVFYDKITGLPTDSIDVDFLTSAVVDNAGKVIEASVSRPVIEFENDNIQNLLRSNKIRLFIMLNSYNGGQDLVKLYTTDFIDVAIGVQTKVNVNL